MASKTRKRVRYGRYFGPRIKPEQAPEVTALLNELVSKGYPVAYIAEVHCDISSTSLKNYYKKPETCPQKIFENIKDLHVKMKAGEISAPPRYWKKELRENKSNGTKPKSNKPVVIKEIDTTFSESSKSTSEAQILTEENQLVLMRLYESLKPPISRNNDTVLDHLDTADSLFALLINEIGQAINKEYELLKPGLERYREALKAQRRLLEPFVKRKVS